MTINTHRQKGVMLLEALIGILIFSIGILALIAMQSVAITEVRDAQYRTTASMLADRMMGELMLTRTATGGNGPAVIAAWKLDVAAALPAGTGTVTETASALGGTPAPLNIQIVVRWQAPNATTQSNYTTIGLLSYN
jgi:type IV pilus assembly protein PilV